MGFTLQFDTDNAAFDDDPQEVARILHRVAVRVADGDTEGRVSDVNGNRVGSWSFTDE